MNKLRRKDRAISEEESIELLNKAEYGVLSTVSEDGKPYGIPLNFCIIDDCAYFHCAVMGQKIDNINYNTAVSFCIVGNTEILPDKFGTKYNSVIIRGEAEEVFDKDKQKALEGLLQKYSSEFMEKGMKYIEKLKNETRVFKISIHKLTGKARK